MAINGVTESFISSIATTADLARQSRAMVGFSIIFGVVAWVLLRVGGMQGEGLVWANCVNMGVRIVWSQRFITEWYERRGQGVGWARVVPGSGTLLAAGIVSVGIRVLALRGWLDGFVMSVGVVGIGGLVLLGCMYLTVCLYWRWLMLGYILKGSFSVKGTAWLFQGKRRKRYPNSHLPCSSSKHASLLGIYSRYNNHRQSTNLAIIFYHSMAIQKLNILLRI